MTTPAVKLPPPCAVRPDGSLDCSLVGCPDNPAACATPVPVSPFVFLILLGIVITVAALRGIRRKRGP